MSGLAETRAGRFALRGACAGLRVIFQGGHFPRLQLWLWDRVVRPHILWRSFRIEARTRFGARLEGDFPDVVHSFVYFFGIWEPAVTRLFQRALRPGDIMVDVGANVGLHSLLASRLVGPTGRVHAVEASPWIYARLMRNIAANGATNIQARNLAATAVPGPVSVWLHDDSNLGGTTIIASEAARSGAVLEATVEGRPLGDIVPVEDLLAARLIKIDVEGAEWMVIQGMASLLPRLREDVEILIEVKRDALRAMGASVEALLGLFAQAGFAAFEVENDYGAASYIAGQPRGPVPLLRHDFEMADLVFRRAGQPG